MKILFITTRIPDPNGQADQFTTWNAIQFLKKKNYQVDVCVLKSYKLYNIIFLFKLIFNIFKFKPFQYSLFDSNQNILKFREFKKNNSYDKFYFHLIRSLPVLCEVDDPKKVFIGVQISQGLNFLRISRELGFGFKSLLYMVESRICKYFEKKIACSGFNVNFVGTQDVNYLKLQDLKNVYVIPHGVNTMNFDKIEKEYDLIFLANYKSDANLSALDLLLNDIFPKLLTYNSDLTLNIAGFNLPSKYYSYSCDNIKILGSISDPISLISKHRIFLNPVRAAAGMQNKVVTSLAAGTPVVSFKSAVDGMNIDSLFLLATDKNVSSFVYSVISLLENYPSNHELLKLSKNVSNDWSWDNLHYIWAHDFLDLK